MSKYPAIYPNIHMKIVIKLLWGHLSPVMMALQKYSTASEYKDIISYFVKRLLPEYSDTTKIAGDMIVHRLPAEISQKTADIRVYTEYAHEISSEKGNKISIVWFVYDNKIFNGFGSFPSYNEMEDSDDRDYDYEHAMEEVAQMPEMVCVMLENSEILIDFDPDVDERKGILGSREDPYIIEINTTSDTITIVV